MSLNTPNSGKNYVNIVDPAILRGRQYAHPLPGEEVCISGISGTFPNSSDIKQLKESLFNKVDLVCDDERRWNHGHPEIPLRSGKIHNIEKFDSGFFGISYRHVDSMDPMLRIILEKAVECVLDAGVNPSELEGTRTGIFIAACLGESEQEIFYSDIESRQNPILGGIRSMLSRKLSCFFKVKGPSFIVDSACSSSLSALEIAYKHIRDGTCDMAIVGGSNLCLLPATSLQFAKLGLLSTDGSCKTFDESGQGYCRSEAIACVFLQKMKTSRRIYAKIVHAKTNCDGFKDIGISHPSGKMQQCLLREFYDECQIDPTDVGYVETHGTGTPVGDFEEGGAIDKVFCTNRDKPLLVGSIKSNLGHTEATSGVTSVIKCLIAMEEGHIPPNIHYNTPRNTVTGLIEGRMKVVVEKTPLPDDKGLMAISSFGVGGANAHVLLEWNHKAKYNGSEPTDDIPRLICVSGRTPEAISSLLNAINGKLDAEYVQLLYEIFKKDIECHNHRGFSIVSKSRQISFSCERYSKVRPALFITFGDFGSSFHSFSKQLFNLPVFGKTIRSIHQILSHTDVKIFDILQNSRTLPTRPVNKILGTLSLQIGIIELLKNLKIKPKAVLGLATGEIACAYFDGYLTLKQSVLTALEIAHQLEDVNETYATYLIKFVEKEALRNLPKNIEITWEYSHDSAVISGEVKAMHKFVTEIEEKGVEVIEISSSDVSFHSKVYTRIETALQEKIEKIIPNQEPRNSFWLSTSSLNSSYSMVYPREVIRYFNSETVNLEIGNGNFSKLLNLDRCRPLEVVSFSKEQKDNGLVAFLEIIGNLYERGLNPQIQNLYPEVQYPVSKGTPMISDKIKWDHTKNWHVLRYTEIKKPDHGEKMISVNLENDAWRYIRGHVIDGRELFPATAYLDMVWQTFAEMKKTMKTKMAIVFENCRFSRATALRERIDFTIEIQRRSGNFEIIEQRADIVGGRIYQVGSDNVQQLSLPLLSDEKNKNSLSLEFDDVYKELSLRGYQYKDEFRLIQRCNLDATKSFVKWTGNWVTFMDNMLQMKLLQYDTRLLYVPIGIRKISIDAEKHLQYINSFGENPIIPVYNFKDADIIRCGGIEIQGVKASSIGRRKHIEQPLLETYEFVSNELTTSLEVSVRINMKIATSNVLALKFNIIEVSDDAMVEGAQLLAPLISEAFSHQTLVQANITVLSEKVMEIKNVTVKNNRRLANEKNCHLVVGTCILQRTFVLKQAFEALKDDGFILSREELDFDPFAAGQANMSGLDIITIHTAEKEKLILFRKSTPTEKPELVEISAKDQDFKWLGDLKRLMETTKNIVMYSYNEENNGVLGLYNCIQKEAGGINIQCFWIHGKDAMPFDINHPFYKNQLNKKMSVNIYKNGKWGTYSHLLMKEAEEVESEHCIVSQTVRENLSSLKLVHGPLSSKSVLPPEKTLVHVFYAAVNFKDVMTASGRIHGDEITMNRIENCSTQGYEFSGMDSSGRRVMGMSFSALSNLVSADNYLLSEIPESWTMEEAATVPLVYGTVLYALLERGKIKKDESILIHSGTGGIGQAAINVALAIGCNVFITVGTPEKKEFVKKLFPQINDQQIGNSRDLTFEMMVKNETNGRGVDLILNSLSEEKLFASVRCLAKGGRFLEIGKFDSFKDSRLALMLLDKECSFHGVMLDHIISSSLTKKRKIKSLLEEGIRTGMVKPLTTNLFKLNEVEEAFRFMTTGKHTGKIVVQIRKEELQRNNQLPSVISLRGLGRVCCDPKKSYVILGGLGGFGLELADWLVLRGARKLVLNSRTGVRKGYQAFNINIWKSYGVIVHVSTDDITTSEGCEKLITEAENLGPVDALFNSAVILKDSLLENQTPDTFKLSFGPKATATKYLDEITRRRCSKLRYFVIFSSVVSGRGNSGQTNYGMANSIMENICETRRIAGYPALAIQWGIVGDVGIIAETKNKNIDEMHYRGTVKQRISSCLQVMDTFLTQKQATIVSSLVLADKQKSVGFKNIVDSTAEILGIKTSAVSVHSTLAELGMDSLTAVEVKQTLESEYDIFLSLQEMRSMTFARLEEIQDGTFAEANKGVSLRGEISVVHPFFKNIGDESIALMPVVRLPSLDNDFSDAPFLFIFPGIDGSMKPLAPLAAQLKAKVVGLQCCFKVPAASFATIAEECLAQMDTYLKPKDLVCIVAYSWGSVIALEVVAQLEKRRHKVNLVILDGAPEFLREIASRHRKYTNDADVHVTSLCLMMSKSLPSEAVVHYRKILENCSTEEERINVFLGAMKDLSLSSLECKKTIAFVLTARMKESYTYEANYKNIMAATKLFKPSIPLHKSLLPNDYNLTKICTNLQEIKYFQGNHETMIENNQLADAINNTINRGFSEEPITQSFIQ